MLLLLAPAVVEPARADEGDDGADKGFDGQELAPEDEEHDEGNGENDAETALGALFFALLLLFR